MLGSEQFNSKPKRGIEFLQSYRVLRTPLDPTELAHFLRENPRLDKRMIGEYLSDRKNGEVLAAYVRSVFVIMTVVHVGLFCLSICD